MLHKISNGKKIINGNETDTQVWKNTVTGNEVHTYLLRVDEFKNKWWAFEDLYSFPFIRQLQAKKVIELYGHGLSLEDIKIHTTAIKSLCRSQDAEKYEKVYAKAMELENLTETMADPVKQCMGLCSVYLLFNDENPEAWNNTIITEKMTAMAQDTDSQAFFLNWWIGIMRDSGSVLKGLSRIVSTANQLDTRTGARSH